LQQRHGEKGDAAFLADVENRDDVLVFDPGDGPRFPLESAASGRQRRKG
jgi:hypothetical protein